MILSLILSLAVSAAEPDPITQFNAQAALKSHFYECLYASDRPATEVLLANTDPFFFLEAGNSHYAAFQSRMISSGVMSQCVVKAVQAKGSMATTHKQTITLDGRGYRDWAVRKLYLDRFPSQPSLTDLRTPKRSKDAYGTNSAPVRGLLETIDCAVRKEPQAADWVIRNDGPFVDGGDITDERFRRVERAFNKCARRGTPDNGFHELLNHTAGLLADSLLRMMRTTSVGEATNA